LIDWLPGALEDDQACHVLLDGCDALVHAALWRVGRGFREAEGELEPFLVNNFLGSIRLFEAAHTAGIRTIFISSCAVHEQILDDRPLDETHPTWARSHYGALKGALEQFVHSYGLGQGDPICSLRPCGVYGIARPVAASRWFELVQAIAAGQPVTCQGGGKVVSAADVARAIEILLQAETAQIAGQAFNCCERYLSDWELAHVARELAGTAGPIEGGPKTPQHQIETGKLLSLGMQYGGDPLLRETLSQLIAAIN
jgi:nucleoside-diphosphate-sugar epimerase